MDTAMLIIYLIILVFALGLGLGLTCLIMGTIIDKTNNIGDSRGTNDDYKAYIHFTARKDKLTNNEEKEFLSTYCVKNEDPSSEPEGRDLVRRLSGKELAGDGDAAAKRKKMLKGPEKKQSLWDDRQPQNDLSGVFRPLKDK